MRRQLAVSFSLLALGMCGTLTGCALLPSTGSGSQTQPFNPSAAANSPPSPADNGGPPPPDAPSGTAGDAKDAIQPTGAAAPSTPAGKDGGKVLPPPTPQGKDGDKVLPPPTPLPGGAPPPTAAPKTPLAGFPLPPGLGSANHGPPPDPHARLAPTAMGSVLQLGPKKTPIEAALELSHTVEMLRADNMAINGRVHALEEGVVTRDRLLNTATHEIQDATSEVARVRRDLQNWADELKQQQIRIRQLDKDHQELLQSVIKMLEKAVGPDAAPAIPGSAS